MDSYNLYWYAFGMVNGIAWGALLIAVFLYFLGKNKNGPT